MELNATNVENVTTMLECAIKRKVQITQTTRITAQSEKIQNKVHVTQQEITKVLVSNSIGLT